MGTFSKSILQVGTYHSPDGVVEVTPERLRHWEQETQRLRDVGYAIPSHFNHGDDDELLSPIAMDVLEKKQSRGAEATVGKLKDFRVSDDGQSAEITLETLTPQAKTAVESNAVYVSPVIYPEWKDGAGNPYSDVITSFDLVDHPVDYSQSSFKPTEPVSMSVIRCIRMGLKNKPYRLGTIVEDDDKKPYDDEAEGAPEPVADTDTDLDGMADSVDPEPMEPAMPEAPASGGIDDSNMTEVLGALQGHNIVLPPDTNKSNFMDRLHTALLTATAHKGMDDMGDPMMGDEPIEAAQPTIATMSLEKRRAATAMKFATERYRNDLNGRIQRLLKTGRCTPSEADKQKRTATTVRLSLDAAGKPKQTALDGWLEAREGQAEFSVWGKGEIEAEEAKKMSVAPPSEWKPTQAMTDEQQQAAVDSLLKHRK